MKKVKDCSYWPGFLGTLLEQIKDCLSNQTCSEKKKKNKSMI